MSNGAGLRPQSTGLRDWPTDTPAHKARVEQQWYITDADLERAKEELMPSEEQKALLVQIGAMMAPWLDAHLEAKARELIERKQDAVVNGIGAVLGDGEWPREQLLCDRDEAAKMLGVSLSTLKRMEGQELPEPIKISERRLAHKLIDVEKLARFRGKARVSGPPNE